MCKYELPHAWKDGKKIYGSKLGHSIEHSSAMHGPHFDPIEHLSAVHGAQPEFLVNCGALYTSTILDKKNQNSVVWANQ